MRANKPTSFCVFVPEPLGLRSSRYLLPELEGTKSQEETSLSLLIVPWFDYNKLLLPIIIMSWYGEYYY